MKSKLPIALKLMAVACFVPALLHGFLGVDADMLIGIPVPSSGIDPSHDSQNRFYGVAFGLYAVLLWVAAFDIKQHAGLLRIVFGMVFLSGCARFLSLNAYGWPSEEVMFLWAIEIFLPPLLWFWLKRHEATEAS
jgi:Domain of unknown function (DUF4345)